jgi:DNA-binding LacI/PurR family transcriptional regulator
MGARTSGDSRARVGTNPTPSTASPASRPSASDAVTMRDIATAAGVSLSTVSRVINESPSRVPIAPTTRERIMKEALRLGYRPNPFARALRGAPTMLLGAVVRDFSDPFFAGALEALAVEAMARGYNIILGHVQGREQEGLALPAVLEPRRCDAVIMLGEMEDQPQLLADLLDAKAPVVALWQGRSPIRFPTVDVDDRMGIAIGLEHLVQLGHQRIGFVSARLPGDNPTREEAFIDFMVSRFGAVPDGYVQRCESSLAGGEAGLEALLGLQQPPTAIACSTDVTAVGVLHGAHAQGVNVPDGLSVVGYDDLMFAPYTVPALTTLRMPTTEIVVEAVKTAVALVADHSTSPAPTRTIFEPTLIVRGSTAAPARRSGVVGKTA